MYMYLLHSFKRIKYLFSTIPYYLLSKIELNIQNISIIRVPRPICHPRPNNTVTARAMTSPILFSFRLTR